MKFMFKPLLFAVMAFNFVLLFVLVGSRGESRTLLTAYMSPNQSNYRLSDLNLLSQVVGQINRDYVDPERIRPDVMLDKALERVQRELPDVMFQFSSDHASLTVTVGNAQETFPIASTTSLSDVVNALRTSLSFVEKNLAPDSPQSLPDIEYAAINGLLNTLDPHSILLPPEAAREMDVAIQGEFGGLGITISLRGDDNILTIINTLPDTPAAEVDLRAGDQILQIDTESTVNMSLNEAVSKLRGPPKTPVDILVNRSSFEEPKTFRVVRDIIKIDSVVSKFLGQGIGYVHVKNFQHNTSRDLITSLDRFRAEYGPIKGLVLDFRNNPGGPLQQAVEVADRFIEKGTLVMTVQAENRVTEEHPATARGTEDKYPIVLIVDAESASASEIVAGAIKNLNRGVIIGDQTFGKGSVQNLYSYRDDSKLKLTMAKYLTPGRKSIQTVGVTPDIHLRPVFFDNESSFYYSTGHIFREKDLDSHFEGTDLAAEGERPAETVSYFSPDEFKGLRRIGADEKAAENKEKSEENASKGEEDAEDAKDAVKIDFQIKFAQDLILKAGRPDRESMLQAALPLTRQIKIAKEKEIQQQFSSLGIDWTPGVSKSPAIETQIKVGEQSGPLIAGQTVPVEVTVTNKGEAPAFQVRAISDSEAGAFTDLEFFFGKLDTGATKSYSRKVKIPGHMFPMAEPMALRVFASGDVLVHEHSFVVQVEELPQPNFAYSLVIVDDGSGTSKGNGDGRIQVGESIDVAILLQNTGRGDASKAMAKIKNNSGKYVYLRSGSVNLKELPIQQYKAARFNFEVKPEFTGDAIELELLAGETGAIRRPRDVIKLPVFSAPSDPPSQYSGIMKVRGNAPIMVRNSADEVAPAFSSVAPGSFVNATGKLGDWIRVTVPMESEVLPGWIPLTALEKARGPVSPASAYMARFYHRPPNIDVSKVAHRVSNSTQKLALEGTISDDEGISSIYVFVNNHKKFLKVFDTSTGHTPANGFTIPLSASIPLEEGANTFEVFANDNEKLQSVAIFQVYREKSDDPNAVVSGGASAANH